MKNCPRSKHSFKGCEQSEHLLGVPDASCSTQHRVLLLLLRDLRTLLCGLITYDRIETEL